MTENLSATDTNRFLDQYSHSPNYFIRQCHERPRIVLQRLFNVIIAEREQERYTIVPNILWHENSDGNKTANYPSLLMQVILIEDGVSYQEILEFQDYLTRFYHEDRKDYVFISDKHELYWEEVEAFILVINKIFKGKLNFLEQICNNKIPPTIKELFQLDSHVPQATLTRLAPQISVALQKWSHETTSDNWFVNQCQGRPSVALKHMTNGLRWQVDKKEFQLDFGTYGFHGDSERMWHKNTDLNDTCYGCGATYSVVKILQEKASTLDEELKTDDLAPLFGNWFGRDGKASFKIVKKLGIDELRYFDITEFEYAIDQARVGDLRSIEKLFSIYFSEEVHDQWRSEVYLSNSNWKWELSKVEDLLPMLKAEEDEILSPS